MHSIATTSFDLMDRKTEFQQITSVTKLFERSVELYGGNPLIWEKRDGTYQPSTYQEIYDEVIAFSTSLMSRGFVHGDRIAILAEGRKDWLVAELGMLYLGVINVPLSVKLDEGEVAFRIEHSGARAIIVSRTQAAKAKQVVQQIKSLTNIIYFDELPQEDNALSFSALKEEGRKLQADEAQRKLFDEARSKVKPDDVANISYTSGTTALIDRWGIKVYIINNKR